MMKEQIYSTAWPTHTVSAQGYSSCEDLQYSYIHAGKLLLFLLCPFPHSLLCCSTDYITKPATMLSLHIYNLVDTPQQHKRVEL